MIRATTKATATTTMIEMTDSSMTAILTGDPLVGVLRSQTVPVTLSSSVPSYLVYSFFSCSRRHAQVVDEGLEHS